MKPKRGKSRAAALNLLLARLREGKQLYAELDDGGRAEVTHDVNAVVEFLTAFEEPSEESLAVPMVSLASALNDISDGAVSPMLKSETGPGGAPESTSRKGLRAIAALTLELLRETGLKRDEAAKQVARIWAGRGRLCRVAKNTAQPKYRRWQ